MGKKSKWFSAVKNLFSPHSDEKKSKEKSKKKWIFGKSKESEAGPSNSAEINTATALTVPPNLSSQLEEIKEVRISEIKGDQNKHAYSVALASAVAAEAAAVAAQAAAEVVRLTAATSSSANAVASSSNATARATAKSKEEIAAIRIQTAFRGFLGRRALRALRGLVRLKSLVDGSAVQRQTENALRYMQTLTRVQFQIRARRISMVEEKQALQKQLQLKQKELDKSKMEEDWDHRLQTKEQIEASVQMRQEAAIRRERALAYAFSHQWRNSSSSARAANTTFTDPTNPQWGWSWVERWMAARPWETRPVNPLDKKDKEPINDHASLKSALQSLRSDSFKSNPNPNPNPYPRPPSRNSPATPQSKTPSFLANKARSASPKKAAQAPQEEDSRSVGSTKSERVRRHSIAGLSVRDDASLTSLTSLPVIPSYLHSTESSRAKSRVMSPIGERRPATPEKSPAGPARKRLSFPAAEKLGVISPGKGGRRLSGPPKIDLTRLTEQPVGNGD